MNFKFIFFAADFLVISSVKNEMEQLPRSVNYHELSKFQLKGNDDCILSTIKGTFSKITKERIEMVKAKWAIVTFYMTTLP